MIRYECQMDIRESRGKSRMGRRGEVDLEDVKGRKKQTSVSGRSEGMVYRKTRNHER